jgi:GT2 family glycosyltransferase/glycosyltransferase involved in cell wall biosynthesis
MKILFFTSVLKTGYGVGLIITRHAEGIVSRGLGTVFVAAHNMDKAPANEDYRVIKAGLDYESVRRIMNDIRPDVTVVHTPPYYAHVARFNEFRTVKIAYDHGEPSPGFFEGEEMAQRERINSRKYAAIKEFHIHVSISDYIKRSSGISNSHVLYNGADHVGLDGGFSETDLRELISVKKDSFVVTSLSRIGVSENHYKGFDVLIETKRLLMELAGDGEIIFVVMGKTVPRKNEVSRRLRKEGFHVLEDVDEASKKSFIKQSDVFVSPSLWEGFNLPLVEAQYLGVPSVALAIGAHPEVCPYIFDDIEEMARYILSLKADAGLRQRAGGLCRGFVGKRFRWDENVSGFISILTGAVRGKDGLRRLKYSSVVSRSSYEDLNERKAVREHIKRAGVAASVVAGPAPGLNRVVYSLDETPLATIIIPTKDNPEVLRKCVSSVLDKTEYKNFEVLIVDNGSTEEETFEYYRELDREGRVRIMDFKAPFNYSKINNYAVANARGDYVLFLNDDMEVIGGQWLSAMMEHARRTEVGCVGAKLYFPDNTIQHVGVIIGLSGLAGHSHRFEPVDTDGYFHRAQTVQNLSAVTAACMLMRKEVFTEAGGFDEGYSHDFNDIDLCMKLRELGYLVVFTPYAELYHFEGLSRGRADSPEKQQRFRREFERFRQKWKSVLAKGDPYYNPNLTLEKEDFSLRL